MQQELTIALVQTDLIWKDKSANLAAIRQFVLNEQESVDIFMLPEMFSTAFCVDDMSLAEDINGPTLQWMQQLAAEKNAAVCGSILFMENEHYFNRFFWVEPDGQRHTYDKRHLFSLVGEEKQLTKGTTKLLIHYKGWNLQPFICYDLRFPAWCQNDDHADVQLYVANWPKKRIHHWKALLQARATENQCYVVAVNRTGLDFSGNEHNGCSAVFDFAGQPLCMVEDKNGITIVKLSKEAINQHLLRYPFWKDR